MKELQDEATIIVSIRCFLNASGSFGIDMKGSAPDLYFLHNRIGQCLNQKFPLGEDAFEGEREDG